MNTANHADLHALWTHLWPQAQPTPLIELPALARAAGVARVFVKVEAERPLGSFKALGGMIAGIRALARASGIGDPRELVSGQRVKSLPRLICASEGNHGLSVAAAANKVGTQAIVYLPREVGAVRVARIEAQGANIVRIDGTYDDAVLAAEAAAEHGDGLLIPDTASDPNSPVVNDVMAGYGLLAQELDLQLRQQWREQPTHLLVQAGVGGLAAAMIDGLQATLREPKKFIVVEPEAAACVAAALSLGRATLLPGDLHTAAEMLACGVASSPALRILQKHAVSCVGVPDAELLKTVTELRHFGGPHTTASGAAGVAALLHICSRRELRETQQLGPNSVVLTIATERALS
ncbi:pyridoxal-phosphate dependent enzyme [Steroidobacter sp.]|uniref:pyridoxal-phosphate dependent enzyme n=1 Tax=Steroidobacter sp. TaxID=1978227 RepID=UPI001A3C26FB|nr:pyridoxal-phosphate dependent enzyme [Steroidobacter sp.]MBL8268775.1 pyridoxal-phosphate dependent enzyme [Steroidobacter sp.]